MGTFTLSQAGCLLFWTGDRAYEFYVAHRSYTTRLRRGRIQIVDRDGHVVAAEYDRIGLNGRLVRGGSYCMLTRRQLQATQIVAVDPAPASFTVHTPRPGVRYRLQLLTRCGLTPLQVDGRWWDFEAADAHVAPSGFGDPFDVGTIVFQGENRATYTSSGGISIGLKARPLDGPDPSLVPCPT